METIQNIYLLMGLEIVKFSSNSEKTSTTNSTPPRWNSP